MRNLILCIIISILTASAFAQDEELTPEQLEVSEQLQADSIQGQKGLISLNIANCTLNIPEGFVFLDTEASKHLLVDYWDNPTDHVDGILGAMVKQEAGIFYNVETAYVISYENAGYVSDEDATSIDYDDLLKNMQESIKEENESIILQVKNGSY